MRFPAILHVHETFITVHIARVCIRAHTHTYTHTHTQSKRRGVTTKPVNTSKKDCSVEAKTCFCFSVPFVQISQCKRVGFEDIIQMYYVIIKKKKSNNLWLFKKQFKRLQENKRKRILFNTL